MRLQMLPLQGSRCGAIRRSNVAAERPSGLETRPTISNMAADDGAAEGGSADMDVGPAFLDQSQIRGMLLTVLSCLA